MKSYTYHTINLTNQDHQKGLFELMNAYMLDKMGLEKPLNQSLFENLLEGLKNQNNYLGVLVKENDQWIGLANCFVNFSTFKAKQLINIHDFVILPTHRGYGAGKFLMQAIKQLAQQNDYCKITLEVRDDNTIAQKLYLSELFKECQPNMHFWEYVL